MGLIGPVTAKGPTCMKLLISQLLAVQLLDAQSPLPVIVDHD